MKVEDLLAELERHGGRVELGGPTGVELVMTRPVPAELVEALRRHRDEVRWILSSAWSEDDLDLERRFGVPSARLYHRVGRKVATPRGSGRLLQVLGPDCVRVLLDDLPGDGRPEMTTFRLYDVEPEEAPS